MRSQCREESVAGTPYTYHNGLAMFTSDTGQQCSASLGLQLGLQQLPSKAASQTTAQPFPLLYGPGTATTAMFLPSASLTQHQLQLQSAAHINNVAAAVQSQVSLTSRVELFQFSPKFSSSVHLLLAEGFR